MATKIKIKPAPGYVFVKPFLKNGMTEALQNMSCGGTGKNILSKGEIVATASEGSKLTLEQYPGDSERVPIRPGLIVFYSDYEPYEYNIDGVIYHQISTWAIKAWV